MRLTHFQMILASKVSSGYSQAGEVFIVGCPTMRLGPWTALEGGQLQTISV